LQIKVTGGQQLRFVLILFLFIPISLAWAGNPNLFDCEKALANQFVDTKIKDLYSPDKSIADAFVVKEYFDTLSIEEKLNVKIPQFKLQLPRVIAQLRHAKGWNHRSIRLKDPFSLYDMKGEQKLKNITSVEEAVNYLLDEAELQLKTDKVTYLWYIQFLTSATYLIRSLNSTEVIGYERLKSNIGAIYLGIANYDSFYWPTFARLDFFDFFGTFENRIFPFGVMDSEYNDFDNQDDTQTLLPSYIFLEHDLIGHPNSWRYLEPAKKIQLKKLAKKVTELLGPLSEELQNEIKSFIGFLNHEGHVYHFLLNGNPNPNQIDEYVRANGRSYFEKHFKIERKLKHLRDLSETELNARIEAAKINTRNILVQALNEYRTFN